MPGRATESPRGCPGEFLVLWEILLVGAEVRGPGTGEQTGQGAGSVAFTVPEAWVLPGQEIPILALALP